MRVPHPTPQFAQLQLVRIICSNSRHASFGEPALLVYDEYFWLVAEHWIRVQHACIVGLFEIRCRNPAEAISSFIQAESSSTTREQSRGRCAIAGGMEWPSLVRLPPSPSQCLHLPNFRAINALRTDTDLHFLKDTKWIKIALLAMCDRLDKTLKGNMSCWIMMSGMRLENLFRCHVHSSSPCDSSALPCGNLFSVERTPST